MLRYALLWSKQSRNKCLRNACTSPTTDNSLGILLIKYYFIQISLRKKKSAALRRVPWSNGSKAKRVHSHVRQPTPTSSPAQATHTLFTCRTCLLSQFFLSTVFLTRCYGIAKHAALLCWRYRSKCPVFRRLFLPHRSRNPCKPKSQNHSSETRSRICTVYFLHH